jgi:hypothetical protein
VVVISVTAVMATIFWQWSAVTEFYQFLNHTGSESRGQVSHKTPTTQSKISRGVAEQQSSADARGAMVPRGQTVPTVGQRVVLYEEDPTDKGSATPAPPSGGRKQSRTSPVLPLSSRFVRT